MSGFTFAPANVQRGWRPAIPVVRSAYISLVSVIRRHFRAAAFPVGGASLSDAAPQPVGFRHCGRAADFVGLHCAYAQYDAALRCVRDAAGKAAQGCQHRFGKSRVRRAAGDDKIEGLPIQLLEESVAPVNHRFHLRGHGVKVDGRDQNDDVRRQHFLPDFRHIVLQHALSAVAVAAVAPKTPGDFLARNPDFLHIAPGFLRAAGKFFTQNCGVPVPAGAAL